MTAILILGAAVWADGPSPTLRRRTLHAARLFQAGAATHLIPCGGLGRHPPSEAEAMRDILLAEGVPADRILPEAQSTTTRGNIANALPILARLGTTEVLIVTDRYHAPRARLVARALGLQPRTDCPPLRAAAVATDQVGPAREVPAYLLYWWRLHVMGQR